MGQRRVQDSGYSSQDRENRARYTLRPKAHPFVRSSLPLALLVLAFCCLLSASFSFAGDLDLDDLIKEALSNNHEVLVSEFRATASKYRIPQAKSLPDPMFMFGYQNDGFKQYTYGKSSDAQWMFSASQMFPFPGKVSLKGDMAARDADSLEASHTHIRFKTVERIKELYYDLFFAHKNLDLIRDKRSLFSRIEDAAIARYSTGTGSQQEVLMAQTEKYMLLEKEEMLKQKIQSTEAMLNTTVGSHLPCDLHDMERQGIKEVSGAGH